MEKLRILVMEDEALISVFLAELLEEMGNEVCGIATTETAAVEAARKYKPDLLIVDANLREGSGLNAVSIILADRFVPHIFMSADRLTNENLNPRAVILRKPFSDAALEGAIKAAIARALV